MLISSRGVIFVHIPKTAGQSIERALHISLAPGVAPTELLLASNPDPSRADRLGWRT